jgi:uncharacterized surface protein with fasciclin (FAS1) repeats
MIRHRRLGMTRHLATLTACLTVVGAACSTGPVATTDTGGTARGAEQPTAGSTPPSARASNPATSGWRHADQVLEDGLPRSTTFANVEFELTGAMVSWQSPSSYAEGGPPQPSDVPHAFLGITAHNRSMGVQLRIPDDAFRLLTVDDEIVAVHGGFGHLAADTSTDGFLAFPVPETLDLAHTVLRIGAPPDTPALLPLAGEVPASGYPIELGTTGQVEGPGQLWGGPVTFEVLGGTISKDLVVERCCPDTGPRANEDELFVTFGLRVTGPDDAYGEQVGTRSIRLVVDGVPREAWHAPLVSSKGTATDLQAVFVVPSTARDLVLQLGDSSAGSPGRLEVVLPDATSTTSQTPSSAYPSGTVMAVLADYRRTAKLVALLESTQTLERRPGAARAVDVVELMSRPGWNHAIFAPTDAALDALPAAEQADLATDPHARIEFFRRHVVQAAVPLAELRDLDSVMTLDGFVPVDTAVKTVRVGGAKILAGDVAASNGVIHVIDAVIGADAR